LTYLAGALDKLDIEIDIVDLITGHGRQTIPIPATFKAIKPFLPYDRSPISVFHTYYHWGASWEYIRQYFSKEYYDICAISSNFYTYSQEVLTLAKIIKSVSPHSRVVVGGQNVGPEHSLFTACPDIDDLIMGEGEEAFGQYVGSLMKGQHNINTIPGIWDNQQKHWHENHLTPEFNFKPRADILPPKKYSIAGKPAIMLSTSRGCPMGCRFCSVSRTFGSPLRLKPVQMIMEEMQNAFDRGIRAFDIEDDNFTFKREHCVDLLTHISQRFKDKITLYAMNGLSAEHLDNEIIDLLAKCGMKLINLSIASSSEEQLKILHRNTSIEHFKKISIYANKRDMKIMGHFIAGLPEQSLDEVLDTMKVLTELPLVLGISPFYYIPGMDMKVPTVPMNCKEARLSRFWPADNILNELDLITLFRLSRWINYLKEQMRIKKINSLHFSEIGKMFTNDPYICGVVNEHSFYGTIENTSLFKHIHSTTVLKNFINIFKNSYICCA
jgi:radical SAM superfamily enzyme YgiQ (UPF0313 family)